ncbi:MAG: ABC transporter permease [Candidatus Babeliales bacterium]|jgi:putative ABC transport system permease protein
MHSTQLIKTAFTSLAHHKGRTTLTMLGVIIGTASIIAIMAIGNGASQEAQKKVMGLGNNYIVTWVGRNFLAQGKTKTKHEKQPKMLNLDDTKALKNLIPSIKQISPFISAYNTTIINKKNVVCVEVKGGNHAIIEILARHLKKGCLFSDTQINKGARVIILGSQAAKDLFNTENPIGHIVQIKKLNFTVIGVVRPLDKIDIDNPNLDCFVPYTTAKRYLSRSFGGTNIPAIIMSTHHIEEIPTTVRSIKRVLRARHHLAKSDADDFGMFDQLSLLNAKQETSNILKLLLIIIASISLLVGGIGVMNIMLVTVTERTKEIGIRMALGAQTHTIMEQFLYEAITICSLGGLVGIGLGSAIPYLASLVTGWHVVVTLDSIAYATLAMLIIGLLFGFYPAYKASRLDPVQALAER